ncbi:MAG: LamG domain-containing protein, partial [Cyclobacteriaceae bacterium]
MNNGINLPTLLQYISILTITLTGSFSINAQNNAIVFNGTDESAQVANLTGFDGVTDNTFTIEAWFKTEQIVNTATIWSIGTTSGTSLQLKQSGASGYVLADVDGDILTAAIPVSASRWHHSAIVYDQKSLILYIDGIEVGIVDRTITLDGSGMKIAESSLPSGEFWDGELDEIRIWDFPFNTEELFGNLFRELDGDEPGLLHYYNFNTVSETILTDITGSADGTLFGIENIDYFLSGAVTKPVNQAIGSGNWSAAALWTLGVPIPLDSVVIGTNSNVILDTDVAMHNLITLNSSTFTQDGFDITITGDAEVIADNSFSALPSDSIFFTGHDQILSFAGLNNELGRLYLGGSGTKTLPEESEITGGVFIEEDVQLDLGSGKITLLGTASWQNNGTMVAGNELELNGTSHDIFQLGQLPRLSVNSSATINLLSDLDLLENFSINNGATLNMGSHLIYASENWDLSGINAINYTTGAKIVINKNVSDFQSGSFIEGSVNAAYPTTEVIEGGDLNLFDGLAISDGESLLVNGGVIFLSYSGLSLGVSAKLEVNTGEFSLESGNLSLQNNSSITINGGKFEADGTESSAFITGNGVSDFYTFILNDGELVLSNTLISNLAGDGIVLNGGEVLSFNKVEFSNGSTASSYITVNGDLLDNTPLIDLKFASGPTFNVRKTSASGEGNINIVSAGGAFAGPSFESVEAGTITWIDFSVDDDYTLNFDGSNDFVSIPSGFDFNSPLTAEAWIYYDFSSGAMPIVGWNIEEGNGETAYFGLNNGKLQIYNGTGETNTVITDNVEIPNSVWTHVAFTYDGSLIRFYLNGELSSSGTPDGLFITASNSLYIGTDNTIDNFFSGNIDEVRLWNTVRTPEEIRDNVYRSITTPVSELVHYYNFDEASGSALNDQGELGINGILINFTLNPGSSFSNWNPVEGKPDSKQYALSFDGVDDYVVASGVPYFNNFTMESWVYLKEITGTQTIGSYEFDGDQAVYLSVRDGRVVFTGTDGVNTLEFTAEETLQSGKWYHIAVVKQAENGEVFINGYSRSSGSIEAVSGSSNLRIGNFESGGDFGFLKGKLDEFRLWDVALTREIIREYADDTDLSTHPDIGRLQFRATFDQGLVPGGPNTLFTSLPAIAPATFSAALQPGFMLSGSEGNYVESTAFEQRDIRVEANGLLIEEFGLNAPSVNDNTSFGVAATGEESGLTN